MGCRYVLCISIDIIDIIDIKVVRGGKRQWACRYILYILRGVRGKWPCTLYILSISNDNLGLGRQLLSSCTTEYLQCTVEATI